MKPLILVISRTDADGQSLVEAAKSQGCRTIAATTIAGALETIQRDAPVLVFCDAVLAEGGRSLRMLSEACGQAGIAVHLIIPFDIKPGLLRSLRPWVHDYLSTPVLREAAAARIRNVLHIRQLECAAKRSHETMMGWLSRLETVTRYFEPLSFDRAKAQADLAARLVRIDPADREKPAALLIAVPDGKGIMECDIFLPAPKGAEQLGRSVRIPESAVFLRIRTEQGLLHVNHFDRGGRFEDFQALFPPELHQAVGAIDNFAACMHGGVYVIAFNYGRAATSQDALFLKGFSLPGTFLGSIAGDVQDMSESFLVMTRALAMATDSAGDNGAHVRRMNEYARAMAEQMDLPDRFVHSLSYSAQLHDVGKIYIHPDLLDKPFRLTNHEFDLVKKHTLLGASILGETPMLHMAKTIALTHHECWDGSGYPSGLSGDAIPMEGAIVKVADVYDALRTMHSYKSSYTHDDACRVILDGGGDGCHDIRPSHFHPAALDTFQQIAGRFDEIYHSLTA